MKSNLILGLVFTVVTTFANTGKAADLSCQQTLKQDQDHVGGGGISGVGGGARFSFTTLHYINPIFSNSMPQLVRVEALANGKARACVYDHHFGQASTVHLVSTLNCNGGETMKSPFTSFRVICSGRFQDSQLSFEATLMGRHLLGIFKRTSANGTANTEAVTIGH